MKWLKLLVVPAVVSLAVAIWLAPDLVHALDRAGGRARVTIDQLVAGEKPPSRMVTLVGIAAMSHQVTEDRRKTEGGSNVSTGTSLYVPIVPEGWSPEQPVRVILKTHYWGLKDLADAPAHDGILRNVLWEGLDGNVATYYTEQMGLRLAPDVLLLDGEHSGAPLGVYLGAIGGAFLIVLLLMWNQLRKKS